MKKSTKRIVISAIVAVMCACSATSVFAASSSEPPVIDEHNPSASYQQKITYNKSEDEIVPYYTVTIPQTVELQKDSTTLLYSLEFMNDTAFVPSDKKVSVKIDSAGYSGNLRELAVWDSRHLQKAEYLIYNSDAFANPTYYGIGDEIASWEGSNWGTVTRKIKLKDYHNTAAGSYNGVINYLVSLENK